MDTINFNKMSEEQLREEIKKLRDERTGIGRKRKVSAKARREKTKKEEVNLDELEEV